MKASQWRHLTLIKLAGTEETISFPGLSHSLAVSLNIYRIKRPFLNKLFRACFITWRFFYLWKMNFHFFNILACSNLIIKISVFTPHNTLLIMWVRHNKIDDLIWIKGDIALKNIYKFRSFCNKCQEHCFTLFHLNSNFIKL